MKNLEHIGEALLPAVAYGDAAGLPVETRSAKYIAEQYGRIDTLLPSDQHILFYDHHTPGGWSDDTQLSIAVAQGLIESDGFDATSQANAHIAAFQATPDIEFKERIMKRGWGHASTLAVRRMLIGIPPEEAGVDGAPGNGVLMKMAPLVYWQVARKTSDKDRWSQYDRLTHMTHRNHVTLLATRVHGDILHYLLTHTFDNKDAREAVQNIISTQEKQLNMKHTLSVVRSVLREDMTPRDILEETDGKGFIAPQTLAMAYGSFFYAQADFTSTVFESVNLGGDTDSIASISGTMALFASEAGVELPSDYTKLDQLDRLQKTSRRLAQSALKLH